MVRIFLGLATVAVALLAVNLVIGLNAGDLQAVTASRMQELRTVSELKMQLSPDAEAVAEATARYKAADERFQAVDRPMMVHRLLGVAAALVTVLVNSIAVTYFIGTSRWCREVSETFRLDPEFAARGAALKRQAFPWALAGILTILGVIALGAAADVRGANYDRSADYVLPHYVVALVGMVVIGVGFWMQGQTMVENASLIDEIMQEVQRVREERQQFV